MQTVKNTFPLPSSLFPLDGVILALCLTVCTAFATAEAQTVSTPPCWRCQWPSGTTEVTIALDWPSFEDVALDADCDEEMNYTHTELEGLLQRGIDTWNRESGSAVRMKYAGLSANNASARVNVVAICNVAQN